MSHRNKKKRHFVKQKQSEPKKKMVLAMNHDQERYAASALCRSSEESKEDFKSRVLARFRRMGK